MKKSADSLKAKNLLKPLPPSIRASQTTHEALDMLAAQSRTLTLLVTSEDGTPTGCLTAEKVITWLLEGGDEALEEGEMPVGLSLRLAKPVAEIPPEVFVKISPGETLALMLLKARQGSREWLLVVDGKRPLGIVGLDDLYLAASTLALEGGIEDLPFFKGR
jgi:CBS domain-containing protein